MADGVLLDTSFLISLVDPNRPQHAIALRYYEHFVEEGIPMYLSAIAASEFQLGQPVADLPLHHFVVLPFNLAHAVAAAELNFKRQPVFAGTTRDALKDDFKLLGQAKVERLAFLITEDAHTLYRYCQELRATGGLPTRAIKLVDGYDRSHFDPAGQRDFDSTLQPPPAAPEAQP